MLFADHFVKWHGEKEAEIYGYSLPFLRWIVKVYKDKVRKQFRQDVTL